MYEHKQDHHLTLVPLLAEVIDIQFKIMQTLTTKYLFKRFIFGEIMPECPFKDRLLYEDER